MNTILKDKKKNIFNIKSYVNYIIIPQCTCLKNFYFATIVSNEIMKYKIIKKRNYFFNKICTIFPF